MISVIGADALGRVIADQCHRPLRVAAIAECEPYQRLTPASAAKVLLSQRGSLKELPHKSEMIIAIMGIIVAMILFLKYTPDNTDIAIIAVKLGKSFILVIFTTLDTTHKKKRKFIKLYE